MVEVSYGGEMWDWAEREELLKAGQHWELGCMLLLEMMQTHGAEWSGQF